MRTKVKAQQLQMNALYAMLYNVIIMYVWIRSEEILKSIMINNYVEFGKIDFFLFFSYNF